MKAPLSWLKDFVDPGLTIAEIAHLLTMAGMGHALPAGLRN